MDELMVVEIGREAVRVALLCAMPMLMAGMAVGILISVMQVATSIQDITITFIPKILAVFLALLLSMHWMLRLLLEFSRKVLQMLATLGS